MHTVGPGIWQEHRKKRKLRQKHCLTWNMARNTENHGKRETHTVGSEIWREKLKNIKNEKWILQDLEYSEKTEKCGK